ncbi:ead/Ea22-like family protein [Salmonella enterica]|nr:ead/Ea22-like family protein [Salmonella enterica subsp. enterica serovar Manhattan]ECL5630434.1 ead/Ea22-like family protein [Salmonella enterica]ECU9817479.1 ead/Ea22-like family protein [Salmonella enterica subsp. enterica serovar Manhattan]ECX8064521.1 ead/Ea22-like family protein [Salmonella enterica]EDF4836399.1 ead/Ea22-like family protein [Salmonella enterica]
MSNIDKQALLVSKAKASAFAMRYISQFEASDIDSDDIDLRFEVDGTETGTTVSIVDECGHAAQIITALLDELEHYKSREERVTKLVLDNSTSWDVLYEKLEAAERRIAELTDQKATWVSWAENASGMVDMLRLRIAELEHSETQLINERDAAESALADMYQAATGERPEWSNMFGFADAVDVVEERLATLEANQSQTTPTGIQLITEAIGAHGYIVGCLLQGRPDLALEESRKWVSAFGQAAEIVSAQDAAGIKVKGE